MEVKPITDYLKYKEVEGFIVLMYVTIHSQIKTKNMIIVFSNV